MKLAISLHRAVRHVAAAPRPERGAEPPVGRWRRRSRYRVGVPVRQTSRSRSGS